MFLRLASSFPSAGISLAIGFVHEEEGILTARATLGRGLHTQFAANCISIRYATCGDAEHCSINCVLCWAYHTAVRVLAVPRFFSLRDSEQP